MTVPRQRHTKSRRNNRRMNLFLQEPGLTKCPKCGQDVLPHIVCKNCGYYKGAAVIDVLKNLTKKEQKMKEREIAAKESQEKTDTKKEGLSWEGMSRK